MRSIIVIAAALIACLSLALIAEQFQSDLPNTTSASQAEQEEAKTAALLAAAQSDSPLNAAQFNSMLKQVSKSNSFTGCYRVINDPSGVEREIELKLENLISIDFNETPLEQVVINIGSQLGISAVIDESSLGDEGLPLDEPITLQLQQPIRARAGLKQVLHRLGLTFIVQNDLLTITTETAADERSSTRIYDVRGLGFDDFNEMMMLKKAIEQYTGDEFAWHEDGGIGSLLVIPGGLIVRQTSKVHMEIESLLNQSQEFVKSPSP